MREDSGGVLSRTVLPVELLLLSLFGAAALEGSSGLGLVVLEGLETEDDEEDSFFLVTATSPVFFFTLSPLTFDPSVFTLTFTF